MLCNTPRTTVVILWAATHFCLLASKQRCVARGQSCNWGVKVGWQRIVSYASDYKVLKVTRCWEIKTNKFELKHIDIKTCISRKRLTTPTIAALHAVADVLV